jgi:hypothetical protein
MLSNHFLVLLYCYKQAILLNINVLVGNFIKTNIMVSIDNSFANLIVSLQKKINLK